MIKLNIQKELAAAGGKMMLDLKMEIPPGNLITLYGESGAGKTSTLRMLAGLMRPDQGQIIVHNNPWFDTNKKINLKPQKRSIGYVFQDYALFPNMTVRENLLFASADKKNSTLINQAIEIVELGDLQQRQPDTLSGGQQQRVALARALVQKPDMLLLDEPLSALDYKIRQKLQDYILSIHAEYGLTTILVSHDLGEIIKLSDKVYIIDQGKITKSGDPIEIFIDKKISGKFQFTGEVIRIDAQGTIYVITVLIQNKLVKVIADKSEAHAFTPGDKVMVATKAFNPIIYKIQ